MGKKTAKPSAARPLFGGMIVGRGASARTLSKGVYVMDGEAAAQVQKLFIDSARFNGSEPPQKFRLSKGEIYYEGGKIKEVSMRGTLPPSKADELIEHPVMEDEKGYVIPMSQEEVWDGLPLDVYVQAEWTVSTWSTGGPDYRLVDDLDVSFARRDLGGPYVAALRIGGPILLRWDVSSAYAATPPSDADVRLIRVPRPFKKSGGRDNGARFEYAISYAEWLARSAREMKSLLKLLRDGREFDFIDHHRAFGHAFKPLLRQRLDESGPDGDSQLRFSIKRKAGVKLRETLATAVAAVARDRLFIRRGRPPGSKTKNKNQEAEKRAIDWKEKDEERRRAVIDLIETEYRDRLQRMPAAAAEADLTVGKVIIRSGIRKSTFYNWLRRIDCKFEDLKTEALWRAEN
jgi:hypothetical protein